MKELIYEPKRFILEYVKNNYDAVVKPTADGHYIEIDFIPDGHNGMHSLIDLAESCLKLNIKIDDLGPVIIENSGYDKNIGDGFRMGRYMYFMVKTTEQILKDLKEYYDE